tara:strand:- start:82 stop:1053 length:972 start_codon:yes stop_codon:yes gene_type:complete
LSLEKKSLLVSAPVEFLPNLKEVMVNEFDCTFSYGANRVEIETLLDENYFQGWLVSPCPTYLIAGVMMDLCPSLKIIATPSTGVNHINLKEAELRGISVFSLKGSNILDTIKASSEFTFNLMISTIRKTPYAFQGVLNGEWRESEHKYRGRELEGLTLGIIGFGRIGSNLANYSMAFDMNVLAYDPYIEITDSRIIQYQSMDDMLPKADVIVLSVPLNNETYGMIDANIFMKMKSGVYFINTSRGDVVNEKDLITFLKKKKIKAAGIDVLKGEFSGNIDKNPLVRYAKIHNNLIITPHIAGLTYDSERKAQTAAYKAIKELLI